MTSVIVKLRPKTKGGKSLVVSLGKAVAKKAALRNLLKRRIRMIMKPFVVNQDKEMFVIVRPIAASQPYATLKKELEEVVKKIGKT